MKTVVTVLSCAFLLALVPFPDSQAQETPRAHAISVNPLGFVFGLMNVRYEQRVQGTNSFHVGGTLVPIYTNYMGFGLTGGYRWYFLPNEGRKALCGMAAGPFLSLLFWNYSGTASIGSEGGVVMILGGDLSYKWIWTNFMLEPSLELGFIPVKGKGDFYATTAFLGLGLHLGYAW
ncbi:MAG: hypothetical protein QHI48_10195 [Bacteroidota bacterium]|nr:hypothetical protein [Bacteroidota bacterium]